MRGRDVNWRSGIADAGTGPAAGLVTICEICFVVRRAEARKKDFKKGRGETRGVFEGFWVPVGGVCGEGLEPRRWYHESIFGNEGSLFKLVKRFHHQEMQREQVVYSFAEK